MRHLAAVRGVIPSVQEPFSTGDICRALGYATSGTDYAGVFEALNHLTDQGELAKESLKRGRMRAKSVFSRTANFRSEPFNPHTQAFAAAFLQRLALQWSASRRAQAD